MIRSTTLRHPSLEFENTPVTTAGVIALENLHARIDGLRWQATRGGLTGEGCFELVELTALRGHVLGRIDDAERAASLADAFVERDPRDPRSFLARARMAAEFHRFSAALADLDVADALGLDQRSLNAERATIYQALGCFEEAVELYQDAASRRPDFNSFWGLARYYAERGDVDQAEVWFLAARRAYRDVSPFPLAVLEFQCGQMWLARGDLVRARIWLESATRRLPAYVRAQDHLAAIDDAEATSSSRAVNG